MKICRRKSFLFLFALFVHGLPCFLQAQTTGIPPDTLGLPIASVEVQGNQNVSTDQILETVSTKPGETVDEEKLSRDVHSVYDLGFFTDVKVETPRSEKGIRVVFLVAENPPVKQIDITGNFIVPASKIFGLMKTTPGKILNTRTLYGDVLAINEYYQNLGYTDPPNHVADLSTKDGIIHLKIQEGLVIRAIKIQGNSVYRESQIRSLIRSKVGDVFNRKNIEADLGEIANLYKSDDYVLSGLKGNIRPDGTVVIDITETRVEGMRVEGNVKTKDYVIYREIKTKVGDVLRGNRIRKDIQRLNNTGFFQSVNVDPEEGTEPGKVVLVWKVKEQKTGTASVGLGYAGGGGAAQGGLTGAVSLSERNIKGTGQAAYFQWQRGYYLDSISLGYTNPWLDKAEDSLAVSYFDSNFFNQTQVIPGTVSPQFSFFSDKTVGESLTVGRPVINEDNRVFLTFGHEFISASGVLTQFLVVPAAPVQGTINSLSPSFTHDTRDDVFDTTRGNFFSVSYERAGSPLGGDFEYNKYNEDVREYFPLPHDFTAAFRILTGWGKGNVPITNWYILGGPDTLRGFDLSRFIGTRMFLGSAELRFPLGKQKIFKGAFFYDAGNAWQPGFPVSFRSLPMDYGFGIRMNLPNLGMGIIRLDFAFGGEGSRTQIGIGQTF